MDGCPITIYILNMSKLKSSTHLPPHHAPWPAFSFLVIFITKYSHSQEKKFMNTQVSSLNISLRSSFLSSLPLSNYRSKLLRLVHCVILPYCYLLQAFSHIAAKVNCLNEVCCQWPRIIYRDKITSLCDTQCCVWILPIPDITYFFPTCTLCSIHSEYPPLFTWHAFLGKILYGKSFSSPSLIYSNSNKTLSEKPWAPNFDQNGPSPLCHLSLLTSLLPNKWWTLSVYPQMCLQVLSLI